MNFFYRLQTLLFLCAIHVTPLAQAAVDTAKLTRDLQQLQQKSGFPGLAVARIDLSDEPYLQAFGLADLRTKTRYTVDSVQNVGSVSKTVVGLALVKAISLGYFTLDTPINDILPFRVRNPRGADTPITVRHLVTHTSGIVDDEDIYNRSYYVSSYGDKSAPLAHYFTSRSPGASGDQALGVFLRSYFEAGGSLYSNNNFANAAGTHYQYSNIGTALAAYLIEAHTGISFDAFCEELIFKPLGMRSTAWKLDGVLAARHVTPYNRAKLAYPLYGLITYPDGGLRTTVRDLTLFLQEMMKGYYGQSNFMSAASFRLLLGNQFEEDSIPVGSSKSEPNSGVLWRIKSNGQIGHSGSDPGITTFMFFDPTTKVGRILLTNMEISPPDGDVDKKLIDKLLRVWKLLETAQ